MVTKQLANDVERRREELRTSPHCTFLEPDEFCSMAISLRRYVRSDDRKARVRGLADPETGETYFAEEEKLFE